MTNIYALIKKLTGNEFFFPTVIVIFGLLLRLYRIDAPIADWHSFRQVDTASVTHYFLLGEGNIFTPKYHDISKVQSGLFNPEGYRFVEFPIYNYIVFLLSKYLPFFDFEVWGRLTSIIFALCSAVIIYLLGKIYHSRIVGLLAMGTYLLMPYNVYFTRVILPEPTAVFFGLLAILLFTRYFSSKSISNLLLSSLFLGISVLVKPYMLFYAIPMFLMILHKFGWKKVVRMPELYVFTFLTLLPFFIWRLWISNFPEGIPFWKWTFNGDGIRFRPAFWYWIFGERLTKLILGYFGIFFFAQGLIQDPKKGRFFNYFLLGALVYVCLIATANVKHDYYQTLIIPAVCLTTGVGIYSIWTQKTMSVWVRKTLVVILVFLSLVTGAFQVKEFYKINHPEIIEAGKAVDMIADKKDLVIASYNGDTAFLYQTKRKGWPVVELPIDELIGLGAKYFVSVNLNDKQTIEFESRFETVQKTGNYIILKLK